MQQFQLEKRNYPRLLYRNNWVVQWEAPVILDVYVMKQVCIDLEFFFGVDTDSNPGQVAKKLRNNPLDRLQSYSTVCISVNKDGWKQPIYEHWLIKKQTQQTNKYMNTG